MPNQEVDVAQLRAGVAGSPIKLEDAPHASADAGQFVLGVRNDNGATTHTGANGDYAPFSLGLKGEQFQRPLPSGVASVTSLTPTTSAQVLVAANTSRRGCIIFNNTDVAVFVKMGNGVTATTSNSKKLLAGETWQAPDYYTGSFEAIIASGVAVGSVNTTELT